MKLMESPPRSLRVVVHGDAFCVDRNTLAEHCEYFRALFRSGMMESEEAELTLQCVGRLGFRALLRVLDGERPSLDSDQIVEAVECAAFLQASVLTQHLIHIVNSQNCLLMFHTATTYGLWELSHSAALFIRDMYADLREELQVFPTKQLEYVQSLLPSSYVAVCSHSPSSESLRDVQRTVSFLDNDQREWKVLTHLPGNSSTTMAGVAVLHNRLYIIGGVHNVSKRVVETGFCYDPDANTWSTVAGPQRPRYNLTLMGHGDSLYAVGGEFNAKLMSSVERYNVTEGRWSFVSSLPVPVASVASAVGMNRMFVCLWKGRGATDVLEYEPKADRWTPVTTLVRQHSYGLHMVAHDDDLYVVRNGPGDDFLRCLMDVYNLTCGQWTAMRGHYGNSKGSLLTAVVRGDSVFTLGKHVTTEYAVDRGGWRVKRETQGFGRIGSMYTFLMRLPNTSGSVPGNCLDGTPELQDILTPLPRLSPECSANL